MNKIALAIHGGAGTILKSLMNDELESQYKRGLQTALEKGWSILQGGGNALDTVEETVVELENCPLFNAGKGSVFTHDGKNEMDASLMDGKSLEAGAVAFIRNLKNPIRIARFVLEKTPHILLSGQGAMDFATEMNAEFVEDEYFFTEFRWQQLLNAREENVVQLDHTVEEPVLVEEILAEEKKFGTVGAVACDNKGNLAAATSTGGMTNKKFGRVGDSPIIGAGTFADNETCAVSCTGHGEFFMKTLAAFDVSARMKYQGKKLYEAAFETVEYLRTIGGEGGLIAVDRRGNVALPFNSEGMYRAYIQSDKAAVIEIYRS